MAEGIKYLKCFYRSEGCEGSSSLEEGIGLKKDMAWDSLREAEA